MYSLYFAIAMMLLVVNLHCSSGEDLKEMMESVTEKCREKYGLDFSEIETAIKDKKLPDSAKGKDFLGCIIKEIGVDLSKTFAQKV